jgi:formylmethanofuran dehydrogenase subunit C
MSLIDMLGYDFKRSDGKREEAKGKLGKIALELICQGYEEFMQQTNRNMIPTEITDRYKPTKEQVLEFSRALVRYKDWKDFASDTSNYLTALMHSSKDAEFEIDVTELNKAGRILNYLGHRLQGKRLTVNGNAGELVGGYAQNSQITVNGNAGDLAGIYAQNSQITVNGNAGNRVGYYAKDSQITVNGNVGDWVGYDAKDSQITVNGNAEYSVGQYAKDSQIRIKGTYKSLSGAIGAGTEICQMQNGIWVRVHPK